MCKVELFVTVGRGMEVFFLEELKNKFPSCEVTPTNSSNPQCSETGSSCAVYEGKVFFHCPDEDVGDLLHLRSVERLFLAIYHGHSLESIQDLQTLIGNITCWEYKLQQYSQFKVRKLSSTAVSAKSSVSQEDGLTSVRTFCKVRGSKRKVLKPHDCSSLISKHTGSLKNSTLDAKIHVHINDIGTVIGIPLTENPLSLRPYLKSITVRSTICYAMSSLLDLSFNSVLIDPMCGAATILVEAAVNFKNITAIGVDNDLAQLQKAQENIQSANMSHRVHVIQGDARNLPLSAESVDNVICDLPFGRQYGSPATVALLVPLVLCECYRLVRPGGRVVMLISKQLEHLLQLPTTQLTLVSKHHLSLGLLPAAIYLFKK